MCYAKIAINKFVVLVLSLMCSAVHAELVLTSPPRESIEDGKEIYKPLAMKLSEILGERVVYKQPKSWLYYQRDMRADKYDIVFDGPHFISWRAKQFGHVPVAKLMGTLSFVVVVDKNNIIINTLDDLVNIDVCAIAPPNLSSMTVLATYENPARLPNLITGEGGMKGVYRSFKNRECKAAILRDEFVLSQITERERDGLKIIFQSEPVANQAISVSPRVDKEKLNKITEALIEPDGVATQLLQRFSPGVDNMIPVSRSSYDEYYKLLTGVIFGWEVIEVDEM